MRKETKMKLIPALLLVAFSGTANASGFALIEQNASGLGNAYAGSAAIAEDASTIYFNPAGLTSLSADRQVVGALNLIKPSAKFSSDSTTRSAAAVADGGASTFAGTGTGGDAGSLAFVPNLYFAMRLNERWSIGVGLNAPFGLSTEYDDSWVGRFQGIKSEVQTVNINPSVAFKVNEQVSLGAGLNYQQINASLTKAVNYNAIILGYENLALVPGGTTNAAGRVEGRNEISGDDTAWGYNLGAIFKLSPSTKLGMAYRSAIKYTLTGTHMATHPTTGNAAANNVIANNPGTINQNVSLAITMPDSFTTSVVQKLSDQWEMMGDASWTGWAKIPELRIKFANGAADDVTPYNFRNTWRVALGATYKASEQMKYRFGVAYDQTPVNNTDRTARLPDGDRTWLSAGLQYKPNKDSTVDAGFAYLFVKDVSLSTNGGVAANAVGYPRGFLGGTYSSNVMILSAQYTYNF